MDRPLNYRQFYQNSLQSIDGSSRQGRSYFDQHNQRFYRTYSTCADILPNGGSVLSVGTGIAYVESQLRQNMQAHITVIDFPEAIQTHHDVYQASGFDTVGLDLSTEWELPKQPEYNLILSCEIIEHIPAPPAKHIRELVRYLAPGGHLIVTTPNLARLMTVWNILRAKPVAQAPELTFGPVDFQHEYVHRREYVAAEIESAMQNAGLQHHSTQYTRNNRVTRLTPRRAVALTLERLNPRFRSTMIVIGRKPPSS